MMGANGERPSAVALGQTKVRGMNERFVSESLDLDPVPTSLSIHCECGRTDCRARLDIGREFYRRVRQRPNQFVVAEGHEVAEVDRVVRRLGTLTVVESTYVGDATLPTS
jgi:hypothetical protein